MSGSRKRDFSLFGEGYDDEFEVEKTNDWDCDCLDLEDDGLDGILSQSHWICLQSGEFHWKGQIR